MSVQLLNHSGRHVDLGRTVDGSFYDRDSSSSEVRGVVAPFVVRAISRAVGAARSWADSAVYTSDADIMTDYLGTPRPSTAGRAAMEDYDIPAAAKGVNIHKLVK